MDYKNLVTLIEEDPNLKKKAKVSYGLEGLESPPPFFKSIKDEIVFPLFAGAIFGLGHF